MSEEVASSTQPRTTEHVLPGNRQLTAGLPVLPMLPQHVAQILAGTKTTTLRTQCLGTIVRRRGKQPQRLLPKKYRLQVKGEDTAVVYVTALNTMRWTALDDAAQDTLAKYEGYCGRDTFVDACIELSRRRQFRHLLKFLEGRSVLWLHSVVVVGSQQPEASGEVARSQKSAGRTNGR